MLTGTQKIIPSGGENRVFGFKFFSTEWCFSALQQFLKKSSLEKRYPFVYIGDRGHSYRCPGRVRAILNFGRN
jgi:hypothetical protein